MTDRGALYDLLDRGLELWHRAEPHPAHEAWEAAWHRLGGRQRDEGEGPEEAALAQALVQLAAARVKGPTDGGRRLLDKARRGVLEAASMRPAALGFDVAGLAEGLDRPADALLGDGGALPSLLPPRVHQAGVVYGHGFGSGPMSTKALAVKAALTAEGLEVRAPALDDGDFFGFTVTRARERLRRCLFDHTLYIGSSMGGYLGALLAEEEAARPRSRVAALVLMAPAFDFGARIEHREGTDRVARWRAEGELVLDRAEGLSPMAISSAFLDDTSRHPGRPPVRSPAYVLAGRQDAIVPLALIEAVVSASDPAVELEVVDDDHRLHASVDRAIAAAKRFAALLPRRRPGP